MFDKLGLGGLGNFASLFRQAQELGGQMEKMADELKQRRTSGSSGGGMVEVEVNGAMEVLQCKIDPQAAQDRELLEDLVVAAVNQAIAKAKQLHAELLKQKTEGMQLPGLHEALGKLGNLPGTGGPSTNE